MSDSMSEFVSVALLPRLSRYSSLSLMLRGG